MKVQTNEFTVWRISPHSIIPAQGYLLKLKLSKAAKMMVVTAPLTAYQHILCYRKKCPRSHINLRSGEG